jgi:hypothetical protein
MSNSSGSVSTNSGGTGSTGNIFQDVLTDVKGVELALLGPSYPYWSNINSPSQMGMSSEGSMSALGNDVVGLINYVEVLVSGSGAASKTGGPLGDKFFLKTGGTCKDTVSGNTEDRYIYINNVPDGSIPFITSSSGMSFSSFEGLIPGVMGDLEALNPFLIMQAFLSGSVPACQNVSLEVIDVNNSTSTQSNFVTVVDLQNMSPCNFPNNVNPITNVSCKESFINMQQIPKINRNYLIIVAIIGLLLLCFILKRLR